MTIREDIQALIDELYDYGVDIDENGNPDILMRTVTELTRLRHKVTTELERAQRMQAQLDGLINEIDCRIEHGAESNGHLEYVLSELKEMRGE